MNKNSSEEAKEFFAKYDKEQDSWEMEDKKNGWRCKGDKDAQRATKREGGRDGGFCPREVMERRMQERSK